MKKIISIILTLCFILALCPAVFAEETLNYVVLGDSIAAGTGVLNGKQACYGKIVADTNGYNYVNYGVNGYRSIDLIDRVLTNEQAINDIKNADIVSISIGGNDFLQQNLPKLIYLAAQGDYHHLDNIEANLYDNLDVIITTIRSLAPDCVILMQTLYNTHISLMGEIYDLAIPRVNNVVYSYLENNPGVYEVIDAATAFDGHPEYVAVDTIHPTAVGNVAMAEIILEKLNDLGLGDNTEPEVNAIGIDEIPFSSYFFSLLMKIFRTFASVFA